MKLINLYALTTGLLLVTYCANAQKLPEEPLAEIQTGQSGEDIAEDMAENWRGDLAVVGSTSRGENGGSDIFFLLTDKELKQKKERYIGRDGDDGARDISVALDGRWLVAGYSTQPAKKSRTRSAYFGGKDGWLLLLAEDGHSEQEFIVGSAADDELTNAFSLADGGYLLAGVSGFQAWALRLDATGKTIWEKKIQHNAMPTIVHSATFTLDNRLYLAGYVKEKKGDRLWVACLDAAGGKLLFERTYLKEQESAGLDITTLDEHTIGITGWINSRKSRQDGFLLRLSAANGEAKGWYPLGGRENDLLRQVLRLHDDRLCFVGRSKSFQRGSRRNRAWVLMSDGKGGAVQERFYGSKMNDEANDVLQCSDGSLIAAGFSSQNVLKAEQAYLLKLTESARTYPPSVPISIKAQSVYYPNGQFIEPGRRTFLPVLLHNPSKEGLTGLHIEVETATDFASPLPLKRAVLPVLPGSATQLFGLPLFVAENERPGAHLFKIQVFHGKRAVSDEVVFTLQVGSLSAPSLAITAEVVPGGHGQPTAIKLSTRNEGNGTAQGVSMFVSTPEQLQAPQELYIGEIPPGTTRTKEIAVKRVLPGDAWLKIRAADAGFQHEDTLVINLSDVVEAAGVVEQGKASGANQLTAIWLSPNPDQFEKTEIVWHENEISISVKVVSNKPVERQHFCIEINGQPCETGQKMDEVRLQGTKYSRTFQQKLPLREGKNTFRAVVTNAAGRSQTEPLQIIYSPRKPNLHIVSIGVPSVDLKYTVNDAAQFARSLAGRQPTDGVFQAVFTDTLLRDEETTKTGILKSLRRLQYRYADRQISSNDLLVVFISSHGLNSRTGSFRIATSDFDSPFLEETSLDFETEVVNYLHAINCHKLFIVDACKSGNASQNLGASMAQWAQMQRELNLLVSCRANEYSYEDDQWQNGAFTEAILQAFDVFDSPRSAEVDLDNNQRVDIEELFRFVEKQVPQLVATKRPKTMTSQHPLMVRAGDSAGTVLLGK
ncbi:MAG: caspase family protein [Saprospiraceae bacterium]|jgi:hypothetical protein|nr:caspase family protein [Saprospiraceae bacterium]